MNRFCEGIKGHTNGELCALANHEYLTGGFSSMFMSRNRVRAWDEQSFTIQAGGRHAPIHPQAPKWHLLSKISVCLMPSQKVENIIFKGSPNYSDGHKNRF